MALVFALALGCGGDDGGAGAASGVDFPPSFRLGVATAAEQIEGGHEANDWYQFTHLEQFAALHQGWSDRASDGYARFDEDAARVAEMGLDAYRMSIEWSSVMPERHRFDDAELAHYDAVVDANASRGIDPFVTLHHFTNPIWLLDLTRTGECPDHPSDANLCGWTNPDAPRAFAEYCGRMAAEYGDRVDHWATFNELNNYLQNAYMVGGFPPGRFGVLDLEDQVIPVARGMLEAHARCYDAIHAGDLWDADGDGAAASVGMTWATQHLVPADPSNPEHVAATELALYTQHRLFLDAVTRGRFDRDLDGAADELHPEWADRLDWTGVQYYSAAAVVPAPLPPPFTGLRCSDNLAAGFGPLAFLWLDFLDGLGCPPAPRLEFPLPGYEGSDDRRHYADVHEPQGLVGVLREFATSQPGLPLYVTENGFGFQDGTDVDDGLVRARSLVRHLDALAEAVRDPDIPIQGYFHWTLVDNYEWNSGNRFRIGLYRVDYDTYERSPTEAAEVYRRIAEARGVTDELRARYGGSESVLAPR